MADAPIPSGRPWPDLDPVPIDAQDLESYPPQEPYRHVPDNEPEEYDPTDLGMDSDCSPFDIPENDHPGRWH